MTKSTFWKFLWYCRPNLHQSLYDTTEVESNLGMEDMHRFLDTPRDEGLSANFQSMQVNSDGKVSVHWLQGLNDLGNLGHEFEHLEQHENARFESNICGREAWVWPCKGIWTNTQTQIVRRLRRRNSQTDLVNPRFVACVSNKISYENLMPGSFRII